MLFHDTVLANEPKPAAIHINPEASPAIRTAAEELAGWFKKASGVDYPVTTNAFEGGGAYLTITAQDVLTKSPAKLAELGPEGIHVRATTNSLCIVGNTDLAVNEGVYLYLERLGFRWFFANEAWHIVPQTKQLFTEFELLTRPDYEFRRIWYGYGTRSAAADTDQKNWDRYNRMGGAFRAQTGHAYPAIINRNKAEFEKHPEYFAILADGQRDTNRVYQARKFCVSSEGLVQLCIDDAFRQFEASKDLQMVSLDPSDGAGSCECDKCKKIGTISDRIFHLANRVAKAVGEKYPGRWVGLYAYSSHQMPTKLKLESNLYVMVATAFNSTPYSIDELIELWGKRVTKIGIREYYGVMAWDMDMPGRPRGARIAYLRKTIPYFRKLGANALSAESSIGWINRGLGQYLAAKLLWDTRANADALMDDFHGKCFGKARGPIEDLFNRWQTNFEVFPTSHDLAVWMKLVDRATQLAEDDATRVRIDQIKMYLHYVALYHDYQTAGAEKQERKAYEDLLRYAWRVKNLGVCASYSLARRLAGGRAPTPEHRWNNPNCVWRDESPVSREELEKFFRADLARYKEVEGLRLVAYSNTYKPVDGKEGIVFDDASLRGPHEFVVQVPEGGTKFQVAGGFVYERDYKLTVKLFRLDQDVDEENVVPILEQKIACDRQFHSVDFGAAKPGMYRLAIDDRRSGFRIKTETGVRISILADSANKVWTTQRSSFYFYVPKGTKKFAIVSNGPLTLQKPNGAKIDSDAKQPLREVAVKAEEAGIWKILSQTGRFHLLGVPPIVAFAPQQMLVPEALN